MTNRVKAILIAICAYCGGALVVQKSSIWLIGVVFCVLVGWMIASVEN